MQVSCVRCIAVNYLYLDRLPEVPQACRQWSVDRNPWCHNARSYVSTAVFRCIHQRNLLRNRGLSLFERPHAQGKLCWHFLMAPGKPMSAQLYDTNKTCVGTVVWHQSNLCRHKRVTRMKPMSAKHNSNKTYVGKVIWHHLNLCRQSRMTPIKPTSTKSCDTDKTFVGTSVWHQ